MEGRSALIAAIISGTLAIAVVTVDLQFGLEAELQTMRDGEWETVSRGDGYYAERPLGVGCATPELRVYVVNDRLFASSVDVVVSYYTPDRGTVTVIKETWDIGPGDVRFYGFTIPDEAFPSADDNSTEHLRGDTIHVEAYVDDTYLGTCVSPEGTA